MIPKPSASNIDELREKLDQTTTNERVDWIHSLGKSEQKQLFEMAKGALSPAHFHGEEGEVVIHEGRNSLPLFTRFQKRVCLQGSQAQGYNENNIRWLVGPGHFLVRPSEDTEGEIWLDYYWVAESAPPEFPEACDNKKGLSRLVYADMIDVMRGVSQHVTIGRAVRGGKHTENYFVLCRR